MKTYPAWISNYIHCDVWDEIIHHQTSTASLKEDKKIPFCIANSIVLLVAQLRKEAD